VGRAPFHHRSGGFPVELVTGRNPTGPENLADEGLAVHAVGLVAAEANEVVAAIIEPKAMDWRFGAVDPDVEFVSGAGDSIEQVEMTDDATKGVQREPDDLTIALPVSRIGPHPRFEAILALRLIGWAFPFLCHDTAPLISPK
jgi:hypothetical protein